jgi:hypothetical protein
MSGVLRRQRPIAPNTIEDERAGAVTRRTVLTGAAATAAATVAAFDMPARAHSVDVNSREEMVLFVLLSSALTGIAPEKLAPGFKLQSSNPRTVPPRPIDLSKSIPGFDPVDVKREYLTCANEKYPSGLEYLLRLSEKISTRPSATKRSLLHYNSMTTIRPRPRPMSTQNILRAALC